MKTKKGDANGVNSSSRFVDNWSEIELRLTEWAINKAQCQSLVKVSELSPTDISGLVQEQETRPD
jgi:hypothetical protein